MTAAAIQIAAITDTFQDMLEDNPMQLYAIVTIVVLLLIVGFTDLESASRPDGDKAA